ADDPVTGGQPEAGAFAGRLRGEEGLEDLLEDLPSHADARVGDGHLDVGARRDLFTGERPVPGVDDAARGGDGERAAAGHGVASIEGEVQQHLLEGARIDPHLAELPLQLEDDADVLADDAAEQFLDLEDRVVDVHDLWLDRLSTGEGEQLPRQARRTLGGLDDLLHVRVDRAAGLEGAEHEAAEGVDDREEIVEVVGDAASEAPHRLHLLGLAELILEAAALREIEHDPDDVAGGPVRATLHDRAEEGDGDPAAVLAGDPDLDDEPRLTPRQQLAPGERVLRAVFGVHPTGEPGGDLLGRGQLFQAKAEDLGPALAVVGVRRGGDVVLVDPRAARLDGGGEPPGIPERARLGGEPLASDRG